MPNTSKQDQAFEGMLEYSRSAVRSLFLLNGGAILALIAFFGIWQESNAI